MKAYDATTLIDATPAAIWAVLTDAPGYARWDSGVVRVDGRIADGEKLELVSEANPKRAFALRVTEFRPGERMAWTGGTPLGLFRGVRTFTLAPQGNGTTRFTVREEHGGPPLPPSAPAGGGRPGARWSPSTSSPTRRCTWPGWSTRPPPSAPRCSAPPGPRGCRVPDTPWAPAA